MDGNPQNHLSVIEHDFQVFFRNVEDGVDGLERLTHPITPVSYIQL
jgi:hypothetical protein